MMRLKSIIKTTSVAISNFYSAIKAPNPMNEDIRKLMTGLTKSQMLLPMKRLAVMPQQPFMQMFMNGENNELLSLEDLKLKCLVLLAPCLMLRSSDVAPRAMVFQGDVPTSLQFTTDQIEFLPNGSAAIYLHSIKNYANCNGFQVFLCPSGNSKVCPVDTLRCYSDRTAVLNPKEPCPVFVVLVKPFAALSSNSVAVILNKAIDKAALGGLGYSAKKFRPTGATAAIENNLQADTV